MSEVPFEHTLAAVFRADDFVRTTFAPTSTSIWRAWSALWSARSISARPRRPSPWRAVSTEEVIDETIAAALGDGQEKPERLALEPWLYRLALRALDDLSRTDESNGHAVHLEDSARPRNVKGSDEPELQFHQPDESITGATVIPDARMATPEQIMASDEMLRLIASALRDLGSGPREAFILHAVEGFSVDEIVAITGHPADCVLAFISCRTRPPAQSTGPGPGVSRPARSDRRRLNPNSKFLWEVPMR